MLLKLKASLLIEALDVVSVVDPRSLTGQSNRSAFLLNCTRKDGAPWCAIYSRGTNLVARAEFPLEELDGEGAFTILSHHVGMWTKVPLDVITFESTKSDGTPFMVTGHSTSGLHYEHETLHPGLIGPCDKDFEIAKVSGGQTYAPGILREALNMARACLPGADRKEVVDEHFQTVQIFDKSNPDWAKGDGHMFCSDSIRAFYFQSSDFEGKGLAVHSRFLATLAEFLSKCSGPVNICRSTNMTYAVNDREQIFGWVHETKTHSRFSYHAEALDKLDKYIVIVPKVPILDAIDATATLAKVDCVKLVYTHDDTQAGGGHTLRFRGRGASGKIESFPVRTIEKPGEPSLEDDFECVVHLGHFKALIAGAKGSEVELRIAAALPPKRGAVLRTIDAFEMRANGKLASTTGTPEPGMTTKELTYPCKVTRSMSSTV